MVLETRLSHLQSPPFTLQPGSSWHLLHLSPDLTCACLTWWPCWQVRWTQFLTGPGAQTSPAWRLEQALSIRAFPVGKKTSVFRFPH